MLLETLSTINAMWDTTFPTIKAVWDAGTPTLSEQREHIHTGALQDELFMRRRQEMLEQAEFNGRFQAAMNALHDIASRAG